MMRLQGGSAKWRTGWIYIAHRLLITILVTLTLACTQADLTRTQADSDTAHSPSLTHSSSHSQSHPSSHSHHLQHSIPLIKHRHHPLPPTPTRAQLLVERSKRSIRETACAAVTVSASSIPSATVQQLESDTSSSRLTSAWPRTLLIDKAAFRSLIDERDISRRRHDRMTSTLTEIVKQDRSSPTGSDTDASQHTNARRRLQAVFNNNQDNVKQSLLSDAATVTQSLSEERHHPPKKVEDDKDETETRTESDEDSSSSTKHTGPHSSLNSSVSTSSTDDDLIIVPLIDYHSVMYTGMIGLGVPQQKFAVIFDSGSSCLWVMSTGGNDGRKRRREMMRRRRHGYDDDDDDGSSTRGSRPALRMHHHRYMHYYNHDASRTYQPVAKEWEIQYGVGTAKGFLSNDTLTVGRARAHGQVFAEATHLSGNFINKEQPMDGILGLSFPGGACASFPTALDTLYHSGAISSRVFSFILGRAPSSDTALRGPGIKDGSQLMLGTPEEKMTKDMVYTKVLHAKHRDPTMWFVKLDEIRVVGGRSHTGVGGGGVSLALCSSLLSNPCAALPDTGTSFLTAPRLLFASLVEAITSNRDDCLLDGDLNLFCLDGPTGLPNIEFTFEGKAFVLTPHDYMLPNAQIALQRMDFDVAGVDIIILGDVFLRKVYTLFDADNFRVGFGKQQGMDEMSIKNMMIIAAAIFAGCLMCCLFANRWILRNRRSEYEPLDSTDTK